MRYRLPDGNIIVCDDPDLVEQLGGIPDPLPDREPETEPDPVASADDILNILLGDDDDE